jgi:hypothetical protein
VLGNTMNLVYVVTAIADPLSTEHLVVNCGYFLLTMVIYAVTIYSYKSKQHCILTYPLIVILTLRQVFRLLDFE